MKVQYKSKFDKATTIAAFIIVPICIFFIGQAIGGIGLIFPHFTVLSHQPQQSLTLTKGLVYNYDVTFVNTGRAGWYRITTYLMDAESGKTTDSITRNVFLSRNELRTETFILDCQFGGDYYIGVEGKVLFRLFK